MNTYHAHTNTGIQIIPVVFKLSMPIYKTNSFPQNLVLYTGMITVIYGSGILELQLQDKPMEKKKCNFTSPIRLTSLRAT